MPIDFRNILYGTALYLCEEIPRDVEHYEERSRATNLLSIKGIELSTEQARFIHDVNKTRATPTR